MNAVPLGESSSGTIGYAEMMVYKGPGYDFLSRVYQSIYPAYNFSQAVAIPTLVKLPAGPGRTASTASSMEHRS